MGRNLTQRGTGPASQLLIPYQTKWPVRKKYANCITTTNTLFLDDGNKFYIIILFE
jgi:hypothetical protein